MTANIVSSKQLSEDKEVILLISSIERLKNKIKEENNKINSCIHILEKENSNYCQYVKTLEIEISKIRDTLNLNSNKKEEINNTIDSNIRDDLKLLYRKISSRCHPDKTENEDLHNIFKNAKKAYTLLDYSELKKLYEELFEEKIVSANNTLNIENLRIQFKKIEKDYIELTQKSTYVMTQYYYSSEPINIMKSKKIFIDLVFSKIFELETLKSNLLS